MPSDAATDAVVLWIAATHDQDAWEHATRLQITAPDRRCGKSRTLNIIEATCHDPLMSTNASPAAIYRSITQTDPPTLLLDEADAIFPRDGSVPEGKEDLRSLLNAGHERDRPVIRYNASTQKVERLPSFAMVALAGIGRLPDTIEDRAVIIRMRRRAEGEIVQPYRRRDRAPLRDLAGQIFTWIRAHHDDLELAAPDMPVTDRAADTWEPLVAVADLAGGSWPERARLAAKALTAQSDEDTVSVGVRLLIDLREAFSTAPDSHTVVPTKDLINLLRRDDEGPWNDIGKGAGLSARRMADLLRPYGIEPGHDATRTVRGYRRAQFIDVWNRYCPSLTEVLPSKASEPA
jgi:hypothetical protein